MIKFITGEMKNIKRYVLKWVHEYMESMLLKVQKVTTGKTKIKT